MKYGRYGWWRYPVFLVWLLWAGASAGAGDKKLETEAVHPVGGLTAAQNLQREGALAHRKGQVVLILFSRADCTYCETVRRDYLLPLSRAKGTPEQILMILQINQDREDPLTDFQGKHTTHAAFAEAEQVKFVPVVAFYSGTGKRLAAPIVGLSLPDFYGHYLSESIAEAASALRSGKVR